MKPKAPCYHCEDRQVGCHSHCEKYIAFQEANLAYNRKRYEMDYSEADSYLISQIIKRRG